MNKARSLSIILVAIATVLGLSSCHVVPPGYRGVKVTLGQVDPNPMSEGVAFYIPMIQTVRDQSVQQHTEGDKTVCYSSDLQTISVNYKILFRTSADQVVNLFRNYNGDPYDTLIVPRFQESLKEVASHYTAENFVKSREEVKKQILEALKGRLAGLQEIDDLAITNIDLSAQLEKAIETKMTMQQEALQKEFELQKAQKDAEITVVRANAEAQAIQTQGNAIKANPEIISLEIARRWNGQSPQSVVVGQGGANVLLPLK
jgi:regulator of protease activity HflC (stomatin/prohibitin superfamily)